MSSTVEDKCRRCHETEPLIARINVLSHELIFKKEEIRHLEEQVKTLLGVEEKYMDLRWRMDGL